MNIMARLDFFEGSENICAHAVFLLGSDRHTIRMPKDFGIEDRVALRRALEKAYDEGHSEGNDEGYDEGYNAALEE